MFERLKQVLVESFVGAIALGWLLAQGILHFVAIFTAPLGDWIARREYHSLGISPASPVVFSFGSALPELFRAFLLLLLCYLLLRWLYYTPRPKQGPDAVAEQVG